MNNLNLSKFTAPKLTKPNKTPTACYNRNPLNFHAAAWFYWF